MTTAPAYVRNGRLDVLAANHLGRAVFSPLFDRPGPAREHRPVHLPRPAPHRTSTPTGSRWPTTRSRCCGPRPAAIPYDRALPTSSANSPPAAKIFRTWWAAHNVRLHRTGVKQLHHPVVGDLTLAYESMELTADPGLRLNAYTAEPGTASQDALNLLASWAAAPPDRTATHPAD